MFGVQLVTWLVTALLGDEIGFGLGIVLRIVLGSKLIGLGLGSTLGA